MWTILAFSAFAADGPAYRALRSRDGVSCADLGEATPALRDELLALTDPAVLPSSVPMRAAGCLVSRFGADPVVAEAVLPWMTDPSRRGLALVVAGGVDSFPEPVAVRIAEAGLSVDDAAWRARFAKKFADSELAGVNALVPR